MTYLNYIKEQRIRKAQFELRQKETFYNFSYY